MTLRDTFILAMGVGRPPRIREVPAVVLATGAIGTVCGVVMYVLMAVWGAFPWADVRGHFLAWLISALTLGLGLGLLLGFYFNINVMTSGDAREVERGRNTTASWLVVIVFFTPLRDSGVKLISWVNGLYGFPTRKFDIELYIIAGFGALLLLILAQAMLRTFPVLGRNLRTLADQAELRALQNQINPHFFFNTLNTITVLIDTEPAAAKETLARLAGMFRYAFSATRTELVTLRQEVEFVKDYLALEKKRFPTRLHFDLPATLDREDLLLPGLTLQPLVENAIRHGISKRVEGGRIEFGIKERRREWTLTVRNQFDPIEGPLDLRAKALFRSGHALANVYNRLKLALGPRASLKMRQEGDDWVVATLELPHP